ncbi:major facilitator superfamily domain-containing protein [Fusarium flagelliforme]|uniref:major facilitator superfamily domain-containing protein n=1 Tax=Fusarium flagelliforme TaxID=2675880 RepID=UPI001E8E5299|nr:major facilitator superfamily domain-containing protein [Fusarium flagelliforme]KAH7174570.1 major facilitator superfamily domain-containing protein [Fusarium flagelliforme]
MATPTPTNERRKEDPKPPSESTPLLGSHRASVTPPISFASSVASSGDSADANPPSEDPQPTENSSETLQRGARLRIVLILIIAVFIFNADRSLVLATHPTIGSEFGALHWSSWLFTAFGLAGAATQTIFGKLGEIYGCKPVILFSYLGFALGCVIVVLSGSVGAGMTVLVSIIISDLVPLRESAAWRSHVNVAATTGRSFGGPLGGWLADTVGWRWSFGIQAPILLVATFLCWQRLPDDLGGKASQRRLLYKDLNRYEKLAKLDLMGASLLAMTILLLLLPMELGGNEVPWSHPAVPSLFVAAIISLAVFVLIEKRRAKDPVLDLSLFMQRDLSLCLLIATLQSAAQAGMMFSVPLYFQVTQQASNSNAGAHLLPAVLGNALGGAFCGYAIKRGFGMGMTYSALFVAIQAAAKPQQVPAAISTLSLCSAIGAIAGVASTGAAVKSVLGRSLETKLNHLGLDAVSRQK